MIGCSSRPPSLLFHLQVSYFLTFPQMSSSMIHYRFIVAPHDRERRPERDGTILGPGEGVRGKKKEKGVINVAAPRRLLSACHQHLFLLKSLEKTKSSGRKQSFFSLFRVDNKTFRRSTTELLPALVYP